MAKEKFDVPDERKPFVKILAPVSAGAPEMVQLTVVVPRFQQVAYAGSGHGTFEVDHARYSAEGIARQWEKGQRLFRDGPSKTVQEKGSDGKVVKRTLSADEYRDACVAHAEVTLERVYGEAEFGERKSSLSPETQYIRPLVVKWAIKTLRDDDGKVFKADTLPSELCRGDAESVLAAAVAAGMEPKQAQALREYGEAQVKAAAEATALLEV